ncbi:MAG: ABC transporter ATP-binding protein, partial [Lachnospiraceae bacterium]|nr:ABC transporter ATP-binding protein [Lachnospiraceae bacterium]
MIEVSNLVKQYGDHYAVDHLSFTVNEGEVLGFLGPNGAGKSTTMNIITGYISATEGTVTINGHDILDEPEEAKKCLGYLPELPPVYPDMTVKEYLFFVAEIKGVKREDRFDDVMNAMESTKITNYQNRLIRHLSKGYRQRTGIAGAMIGNPQIIILDEPTVGLDPSQIIEVRDLIKSLAKDHTIILSSHIMQEISAVCDRVLIINKGKMIVNDSIKDLSRRMSGSNRLE